MTIIYFCDLDTPPEGAFIRKYENPFVITDEDITEAAPQFTLMEKDDIDINVEDDIFVVE